MPRISPEEAAVVTGSASEDEAGEASEPSLSPEPILVYVPAQEPGDFCKAEKVVLRDDKVNIGMWAFKCVTMTDEEAKADPLLAKGKSTPRFYVIDRDYRKVKVIEGKSLSAKKLFTAMEKSAGRAYKQKLGKMVKSMQKILNEYDKINNERKVLEQKRARNKGEMDKKMERTLEEINERETKAKEEHKELLAFELK